ncbi:dynein regulatory complex protein 1 [Dicentrarchus labrax]|uniref:Dynein regulatory complex protein 1 n=3 Tax=Dicentrarchus labrax TaxID=13489 RepID=A0A8P4GA11_DICLA|nr:dynein regulatory complex protein 1 [Dicentrarchus labrax]
MEEVDMDPEEASETSVLSENQEAQSGVSTQEENPSAKVNKEVREETWEFQLQEEEEEEAESEKVVIPQRIINLQRELPTLVTNIQTAADAKESMRRTELEEARKLRLERLENDVKSSQEKFEEITSGWLVAKQKMIPQELQEALNYQQQLCAALLEDKKKLINDLQQELKVRDDHYVKDLRKQAEELDLVMERMEDQIKTLTKAYREELDQMERVYQQECEVLLTRDKDEWEQYMEELLDKELERLTERMKKVEEYEAIIHNLMLETTEKYSIFQMDQNSKFQVLERENHKIKTTNLITKLKQIKQKDEVIAHKFNLACIKRRMVSLRTEIKNLKEKYTSQEKEFSKRSWYLSEDYKRNILQYERIQKKIKHFAAADVKKFEDMWLMIEAEVKQLVERSLLIDSLICKQHLGLAWERPLMPFMELSGPIQSQKQAWRPAHQAVSQSFQTGQALQCSQRTMDASVGPRLETDADSTDMEMYKEGTAVQSESGAEVEEGKLSMETLKKVMELLCDEAGFLMEDKLLNLLAPLEEEEQTVVKLGSLLCAFDVEEEDMPKLAHFLLKYKHQQREQNESGESIDMAGEVENNSTTHLTSELIDPNHVVPALKSFLRQLTKTREISARQQFSLLAINARDTSEDEAYWESMSNVISEDKLKVWDAAENTLKQYHAVLTEISDIVPETQSLEQQNTELRMLLQQSLNSSVNTELENA